MYYYRYRVLIILTLKQPATCAWHAGSYYFSSCVSLSKSSAYLMTTVIVLNKWKLYEIYIFRTSSDREGIEYIWSLYFMGIQSTISVWLIVAKEEWINFWKHLGKIIIYNKIFDCRSDWNSEIHHFTSILKTEPTT